MLKVLATVILFTVLFFISDILFQMFAPTDIYNVMAAVIAVLLGPKIGGWRRKKKVVEAKA